MKLLGLELNASVARAAVGSPGAACAAALDGDLVELPQFVSLEGRHAEAGRAGAALCRRFPHLACHGFLADLCSERGWSAGRHRLNADRAMLLVFERTRPLWRDAAGLVFAVPPYLSRAQVDQLALLARSARMPLSGTLPTPLAIALGGPAERRSGIALVIDVDLHALTCSLLKLAPGKGQLQRWKAFPEFNQTVWKECALRSVADLCIRQSRRDPRDSGAAEQLLYDQLDDVFEMTAEEQMVEVVIRASNWCQNLILQPWQVRAFCGALAREASAAILDAFPETAETAVPLWIAAPARALPGLLGELCGEAGARSEPIVLSAHAAALGAHSFAARIEAGEVPRGHAEPLDRISRMRPRLPLI